MATARRRPALPSGQPPSRATVTKPGTLTDTATMTATNVTADSDDTAVATVTVLGT